jgi:hypothetical protein
LPEPSCRTVCAEGLILDTQQGRLIGHIARDATAIEARERFSAIASEEEKA